MNPKKSALGRGLGALIEDAVEATRPDTPAAAAIDEVDITLIEVNPFQPRQNFDQEALNELAVSIKEVGIIQPITVRQLDNGKYQIISGERRYRASQLAGLSKIPAYVRKANDQDMLEMALVENIQREDLDSIEVAISYQRLIDECSLTQETLSERVGKKRSTVANYLRLLKLPAEIQLGIRLRKLSMGHAKALVNIESSEIQLEIYNQILEDDLSVRQVEALVRHYNDPQEEVEVLPKITKDSEKEDLPEIFKDFKNQLRDVFKSKVELKKDIKGSGKIIIPFKSENELLEIMSLVEKVKNLG
jgi:ParB family transcriptional regulator, chromosome partitioning protein